MKNKKTEYLLRIGVALMAVAFVALPVAASAHVLATDGTMGAVLHIDPDDDPIANAPAQFFFQYKNTAGPFSILQCNCTVGIRELAGTGESATGSSSPVILSLSLQNGTTTTPNVKVTDDTLSFPGVFPERAVYVVTADGSSTATSSSAAFPSFHLSYNIRVDREAAPSAAPSFWQGLLQEHLTHLIIVIVGIGVGIVITVLDKKKRKT